MGTCFGYFKKRNKSKRHVSLHRCFYFHNSDHVEFELLVHGNPKSSMEFSRDESEVWFTSKRYTQTVANKCDMQLCNWFYLIFFFCFCCSSRTPNLRQKKDQKPALTKWTDGGSGLNSFPDNESTQLLPLDAHSLLASRALQSRKISWSSTTPPSSVDLEWENEGGVLNIIPRLKSLRSSSSNMDSSSGGAGEESPESLEWDPGTTDNETEQLISEIERLTSSALRETGTWSSEPL